MVCLKVVIVLRPGPHQDQGIPQEEWIETEITQEEWIETGITQEEWIETETGIETGIAAEAEAL